MKFPKFLMKNIWLLSWLGCLLVFAASALTPTSGPAPGSSYHLDKLVHLFFFAGLTIIPLSTFKNRKLAFFCTGIVPIYGFFLEYLQKNISGREFSPEDMIANNAGIILGISCGIILRVSKRFRRLKGIQS